VFGLARWRAVETQGIVRKTVERIIHTVVAKGMDKVATFNRRRLPALERPNPFLNGIHTPMSSEKTLYSLRVEGEIPASLNGRYLRIGPNPIGHTDPRSHHWFLGDGMTHGIKLEGGKAAWYRNRWVRSTAVSKALNEAPIPGPRRGTADNANTNIIGHAGRTYALVEAGAWPVELNDELETIAHNPFDGTLDVSFSAHPHLDRDTRELHTVCYDASVKHKVWHVVVDSAGKVIRQEAIPVEGGPTIHDCQITQKYVLVFDLPATVSMKKMLAGYPLPFEWNPSRPARVGLCPRAGSAADTIWCDVDPCYVFHTANAYETEDGEVIVDVVAHDSMYARSNMGPDSKRSCFERWTIDPTIKQVVRKVIHDQNQEFPRYDERLSGKAYRYAYSVGLPSEDYNELSIGATTLYKHDLAQSTTETHDFGANRYPGEFVFVARSDDAKEDEGWLVGFVVDLNDEHSELVILNAEKFTDHPTAKIHIPHRIPPGFHGNWVPVI